MNIKYVLSKDDVIMALQIIKKLNAAIKDCHILVDKQVIYQPFMSSLNHSGQQLFKEICEMNTLNANSIIISD